MRPTRATLAWPIAVVITSFLAACGETSASSRRDQAVTAALAAYEALADKHGAEDVYLRQTPLEPGQVVSVPGDPPGVSRTLTRRTWLAWVDRLPFAPMAHPAAIVLVADDDLTSEVIAVDWWPVIDGTPWLDIDRARWASPERIRQGGSDEVLAPTTDAIEWPWPARAERALHDNGGGAEGSLPHVVGLILNAFDPDEANFTHAANQAGVWTEYLTAGFGADVPGGVTYARPETPEAYLKAIADRCVGLGPNDKLVLVSYSHGDVGQLYMSASKSLLAHARIAAALAECGAGYVNIYINACRSGTAHTAFAATFGSDPDHRVHLWTETDPKTPYQLGFGPFLGQELLAWFLAGLKALYEQGKLPATIETFEELFRGPPDIAARVKEEEEGRVPYHAANQKVLDAWNAQGASVPGQAVYGTRCLGDAGCDDGHAATTDHCNKDTGRCEHVCDAAICASWGEAECPTPGCQAGVCPGADAEACMCVNDNEKGACGDGRWCVEGQCLAKGTCPICQELDASGTCVAVTGFHACDTGDLCVTLAQCEEGHCVAKQKKSCDDQNACTTDNCVSPAGTCDNAAIAGCCRETSDCTPSTDPCATILCHEHVCTPYATGQIKCTDDGDACTDDVCDGLVCTHPKTTERCCTDDEDCAVTDVCTRRACVDMECQAPTPIPGCCHADSECEDGDACTTNACRDHVCQAPEAVDGCCNVDSDCDDQDVCTTDRCLDHRCQAPTAVSGCCHEDAECEDGDFCTRDACLESTCQAPAPIDGCCHGDGECGDEDACTTDVCVARQCGHPPDPSCALGCCLGLACEARTPSACQAAGGHTVAGDCSAVEARAGGCSAVKACCPATGGCVMTFADACDGLPGWSVPEYQADCAASPCPALDAPTCCLLPHDTEGFVTETTGFADCLQRGGSVLDPASCEDICCHRESRWEAETRAHCHGEIAPIADCGVVCCETSMDVREEAAGECRVRGGTAVDAGECRQLCCLLPNGATAILSALECQNNGGGEVPRPLPGTGDDPCGEVCCHDPASGTNTWSTRTACLSVASNFIDDAANCDEVCCFTATGTYLTLARGSCEKDGGRVEGAGACEEVCCKFAGQYQPWEEHACLAVGGVAVDAADCAPACCMMPSLSGPKPQIRPAAECRALNLRIVAFSECAGLDFGCTSDADCFGLDGQPFEGSGCAVPGCDLARGECVTVTRDDGTGCTDHDPCTVDDHCVEGTCQPGDPPACAEGEDPLCKPTSCEPHIGQCVELTSSDPVCQVDACFVPDPSEGGAGGGDIVGVQFQAGTGLRFEVTLAAAFDVSYFDLAFHQPGVAAQNDPVFGAATMGTSLWVRAFFDIGASAPYQKQVRVWTGSAWVDNSSLATRFAIARVTGVSAFSVVVDTSGIATPDELRVGSQPGDRIPDTGLLAIPSDRAPCPTVR